MRCVACNIRKRDDIRTGDSHEHGSPHHATVAQLRWRAARDGPWAALGASRVYELVVEAVPARADCARTARGRRAHPWVGGHGTGAMALHWRGVVCITVFGRSRARECPGKRWRRMARRCRPARGCGKRTYLACLRFDKRWSDTWMHAARIDELELAPCSEQSSKARGTPRPPPGLFTLNFLFAWLICFLGIGGSIHKVDAKG